MVRRTKQKTEQKNVRKTKQLNVQRIKQKNEQGSVVILVALALTVLLGFAALVVDLGILYVRHAELQNALDAAALAGSQELPHNPAKAEQVAIDYAQRNGVSNPTVSLAYQNSEITVSAEETVATYFARIWGINEDSIAASSKAMMVPPDALSGVVPLSVEQQDFVFGVEYSLKSGPHTAGEEDEYSSWFGALELSNPGAKDYETDLTYGYEGILEVGQILDIKPGNMSGPTQRAIEARLDQDTRVPRNTFDDYERGAPELVYVPIVEVISESGDAVHQVQIVGFAAFFLEGVEGVGNESIVTGRFLQTIVPNSQSSGSMINLQTREEAIREGGAANDYGLYAPKLVE